MRRESCFLRLDEVVRGYRTVLTTVDVLIRLAMNEPRYLHTNRLELSALRTLREGLHDLYFTRMFACFESDLRQYWRTTVRDTRPPTEQLLSSVAARRDIPQDTLDYVQRVREFRNSLIHEEHEIRERWTIDGAIKVLNAYLARLPLEW